MKNVTVSIDETIYREARVAAAQRGRSLSALVREYLQSLAVGSGDEDARRRKALAGALKACRAEVGDKPTRARTYAGR